jgi:hypothetical protein
VKNILSGMVLSILLLGAGSVSAATLESQAVAVRPATQYSQLIGIDSVTRKAGQALDIGGTHIFAVLGGGLIAVSLVARRRSS